MAVYIADYEDCIELLINANKDEYDERVEAMAKRMSLLAKGSDVASPWYRFCYAGAYLHRAIVNIRFNEQYKAAYNFRKSFALLHENERLYPGFANNMVIAGLQEAVVGALPRNYRWLASVLGVYGNVRAGTAKLQRFVALHDARDPLYDEAVLYYLYARFYLLSEQQQVWDFLCSDGFSDKGNLLRSFVKANIALDFRKADSAVAVLDRAADNADYGAYPIFEHQMGMALLARCDTNCVTHFNLYLQHNKSDLYVKDSWQKMAFAWYVWGRQGMAQYCKEQIAQHGLRHIDADKQAARFAEQGSWPNRMLLMVRLLTDGGYTTQALGQIEKMRPADLRAADRAEYHYRKGRIYEELAQMHAAHMSNTQALDEYRKCIQVREAWQDQFAARAALQRGRIFERLSMADEAIESYRECLDLPQHDFQNSIDQQAKAGLNRIEWAQKAAK